MKKKEIDFKLTCLLVGLLLFGIIMISSVSVYWSYKLTSGATGEGINSYFVSRTILFVFIGILVMTVFAKIPYQILEKYSPHIYGLSILGLILVLVPGVGKTLNGATGWLKIPGLPFLLQPAEFAKIGIIIILAYFIKKRRAVIKDKIHGFGLYFVYVAIPLFFLMIQPDFGSILIIAPITLMMYYIGGGNKKFLQYAIIGAFVLAIGVYAVGTLVKKSENEDLQKILRVSYISTRIDNFFRDEKEIASTKTQKDSDYQLRQGFIALGSGGFWGLGFGKSIQKYGYLPEPFGDFIFSIIVEEMGFVGGVLLLLVYVGIAYRGFAISRSVHDLYGKSLAFGITSWFVVQAFINIGVNLNVIPLTGVTLPFVSYGGSSILTLCIASGILLSISRYVEYKPQAISETIRARKKALF